MQTPGAYRLHVFAAGAVQLRLAGRLLLDTRARGRLARRRTDRARVWLSSARSALPAHDEPARLALFWAGPQFALEPVAGHWLSHEASQSPSDDFKRGARWVRAGALQACHDVPSEPAPLAAPALESLAGNLSRRWLVNWLSAPGVARTARRMPHFSFDRQQAADVADYLLSASRPIPQPSTQAATEPPRETTSPPTAPAGKTKPPKNAPPEPPPPNAATGSLLFHSLGCLACHRVEQLGAAELFGGGDLTRIADKRPADFFARWLTDPAAINRDHRMPIFALEPAEIESLSLYLRSLGGTTTAGSDVKPSAERIAHGKQLVEQARCGACHALPGAAADCQRHNSPNSIQPTWIDPTAVACLSRRRPRIVRAINSPKASVAQVSAFIKSMSRSPQTKINRHGADLLVERGCVACHARPLCRPDGSVAGHRRTHPELRDLLPASSRPRCSASAINCMTKHWLRRLPPARRRRRLVARADAPFLAFRRRVASARRPVHRYRSHPAARTGARERQFCQRIRRKPRGHRSGRRRLVTADGFGCTSCHAIGRWQPRSVALAASGSNLAGLGGRVRREWFDRWVQQPGSHRPADGDAGGRAERAGGARRKPERAARRRLARAQRAELHAPRSQPLRVVRRSNVPGVSERAAVLTDLIQLDGARSSRRS